MKGHKQSQADKLAVAGVNIVKPGVRYTRTQLPANFGLLHLEVHNDYSLRFED